MASADDAVASPKKRSHSEFESDQTGNVKENGAPAEDEGGSFTLIAVVIANQPAETSSDDDFGPELPSTAPRRSVESFLTKNSTSRRFQNRYVTLNR